MEYLIRNENDDIIKKCGSEIIGLQKGDMVWVDGIFYKVDNKHLDYDENNFTIYVEVEE